MMKNQKASSVLVVTICTAALVGVHIDRPILASWGPFVTMMPFTAILGLLSLAMLVDETEHQTIWSYSVVGMSVLSLLAYLEPSEPAGVYAVGRHIPSLATVASFLLLIAAHRTRASWLPMVIYGIISVAVIGYVLGNPVLYYYWPGVSTAMALPTITIIALLTHKASGFGGRGK